MAYASGSAREVAGALDIVIGRRLRRMPEMLTGDMASMVRPTDEELQAYLDEKVEDLRTADQVFGLRVTQPRGLTGSVPRLISKYSAGCAWPPESPTVAMTSPGATQSPANLSVDSA